MWSIKRFVNCRCSNSCQFPTFYWFWKFLKHISETISFWSSLLWYNMKSDAPDGRCMSCFVAKGNYSNNSIGIFCGLVIQQSTDAHTMHSNKENTIFLYIDYNQSIDLKLSQHSCAVVSQFNGHFEIWARNDILRSCQICSKHLPYVYFLSKCFYQIRTWAQRIQLNWNESTSYSNKFISLYRRKIANEAT